MKVIIIGAGIIGCAAARFLSEYEVDIMVIERGSDVAVGASKANSGILHAGYDCEPGTVKARANVDGLAMYGRLVRELDIPCRVNGSMVVEFDGAGQGRLEQLYENGLANGVRGLELLSGEEALALEPNLSHNITAALRATTAGIISPYEATIAFGENAVMNGAEFLFNTVVTGVSAAGAGFVVRTSAGNFATDVVINAAGVNSGEVFNMACGDIRQEEILPQRGQYYLLDNTQRDLVQHTIFQLPTRLGKGVLVAPTVDGNILLGPTAENIPCGENTETTPEGLREALEKVNLSLKNVPIRDRIANFAGVRAKHAGKDFIIEETKPGFISAIGIDSPGLTAAPAIAAKLADMALARVSPRHKRDFNPHRPAITRFRELDRQAQAELIAKNSAFGRVVCRCETITEAEILESIRRPIGARNLDAIKRRTRAQMGRCHGGFCSVRLMELLGRELGIAEEAVGKS
ncbi:MAG: NAD(P)/FAD-dependent oxidoreductase [Defluviitaleaceae bacterium]|nr:NAD(P)/FAD-dependent oxidoreductase [Defluviitaleaceae bacterium]